MGERIYYEDGKRVYEIGERTSIINCYDQQDCNDCNDERCLHFKKQYKEEVNLGKYKRNQRQEDGSGVPDAPKMMWNADGSPNYEHLKDEGKEQEDTIEMVQNYLVKKHGVSEGTYKLRTMKAEQFIELAEALNREKFNNAAPGTVGIRMPKMKF